MITSSCARDFVLCPRKVYLGMYGPSEKKLPPAEFMLKKAEEGIEFEKMVASRLSCARPSYRIGDFVSGAEKTQALLRAGEERVYQAVITFNDLLGIPDFLEKSGEKSSFGDYSYSVVDIKTGLSVKRKYIAQVVFYSYILSKIQGVLPKKAFLILGDESRREVKISEHIGWFMESLAEIRKIAGGKEIQPSRVAECPNCRWHDFCFDLLLKRRDISLLYKVSREEMEEMKVNGISSLDDVASIDVEKYAGITGIAVTKIKKWKLQAKSWVENRPVVAGQIDFPEKKVEIFLDFESEDATHYLIGLLVRDGNEKPVQFVAHKREDEKKAWEEFLDFMQNQHDFVVYHYGPYDRRALRQLSDRYGIPKKLEKQIFGSLFDLLKVFHDKVMLPTWSYSLKPVAKYLGFRWRNKHAKGDISTVWYDSYIKTGDKKFMGLIKEYNEDDLIATRSIKDWLCKISR